MKITFRWYGENDPISLKYINQIPNMYGIVSAIYDVPVGEVWSNESILKLKENAENASLKFEVVESVPVHEDIKLGKETANKYIENYCENIRRLSKAGVKVICYNFMPVFDWLRSELDFINEDGSSSLSYDHETVLKLDPKESELSLPGWDESYTKDKLKSLLEDYKSVDEEKLWENLKIFLEKVIPVAEACDVKMAIHPDDPPWSMFGLPRIISSEKNMDRFLKIVDSPYNGITFCTGSFGSGTHNNIEKMLEKYVKRSPFIHLRNVEITGEKSFKEVAHFDENGIVNSVKILKILFDNNFDGYIRPDHGRMIWGETGRAGYGLYDRALGASYINGIWQTLKEINK